MKTHKNRSWITALVATLTLMGLAPTRAETLGDLMKEAGLNRMIGRWVDAETKGERIKVNYLWKFKGAVIESSSEIGDRKSIGLIALNAETKEVYHVGADDQGGTSLGTWDLVDKSATLEVRFIRGNGEKGKLIIKHHLQDKDTLILTIEADEPVEITLVRVPPKARAKK